MAKYTLKTFQGNNLLECFEHRSPSKLESIIAHPRHHRANVEKDWDDLGKYADRFELYDSHKECLFDGNVGDLTKLIKQLKKLI